MRKLLHYVFILLIIVALGFFIQPGYYLISPGTADALGNLIRVGGEVRQEKGQFFMVTVAQHPVNLWTYLYGAYSPQLDLRPISTVIPPDMSLEEYNKLMQDWMQESKYLAQIIALRKAGYTVPIVSDGVEIVELMEDSPAKGILQKGDIIKAVEGKEINLAEELVGYIQEKQVGQKVKITVQQDEKIKELQVLTIAHRDEPGKAALGIYVRTLNWHPLLPLEIEIDTGPVIGPSAGTMFVLEILDRLTPENLAGGHSIAGTGTISIDEKIGGIGGVKQKVVAAENSGIKYFLVPAENYAEARQTAAQIKLVPVENLDDALDFLKSLPAAEQGGSAKNAIKNNIYSPPVPALAVSTD